MSNTCLQAGITIHNRSISSHRASILWGLLLVLLSVVSLCCDAEDFSKLQDGDIIFQIHESSQSKAIQLATHSKYTHMGVIFKSGDEYLVCEGVGPVQYTALEGWIHRGEGSHFVVKRLKNAEKALTSDVTAKMKKEADDLKGKAYDWWFGWSDDKIYCSELVWKVYERGAGIELAVPMKLTEFDLSHKAVQEKIKERYPDGIPQDEKAVAPGQIFDSTLLTTVMKG